MLFNPEKSSQMSIEKAALERKIIEIVYDFVKNNSALIEEFDLTIKCGTYNHMDSCGEIVSTNVHYFIKSSIK